METILTVFFIYNPSTHPLATPIILNVLRGRLASIPAGIGQRVHLGQVTSVLQV